MAKRGKKYKEAASKVEHGRQYSPQEALSLVKETSYTKFDASVEVHIRLGVDPRHADQQVRDVVVLPHGLGKDVRVLVFAQGDAARAAREAGADGVADDDATLKKIGDGWLDFDVAIATPDMMGVVGRIGRVLGPRGLMPNPKGGTVVNEKDLVRAIEQAKAGRVEFRLDKTGNVHVAIGKVSFEPEKLQENFSTLLDAIIKAKPAAAKGAYIRSLTLCATMGPAISVDPLQAQNIGAAA
ncbi:MAG: 50S ribosomal protein L1 [Anaerolineales bacterium]|nr:50S ribosomal protein L1 [Anaerolineales bacterium]